MRVRCWVLRVGNEYMTNRRYVLALLSAVVLLFVGINRLWTWADWGVVGFGGDSHQVMAVVKSFSDGDATPFGEKIIEHLGAPFGANWFDFPFEDALWFIPGVLASWIGVPHALMIYLLLICFGCAAAFSYTGLSLGYRREWVFVCSILFAFSPYLFYRLFGHMNLTAYWHVPLLLYAVVVCGRSGVGLQSGRMVVKLSVIGVVAGLLSAYYMYVFLFLVGFVVLGHLFGGRYQDAKVAAYVLVATLVAFVFQHLDTLYFNVVEGANPGALARDHLGMARWGLRLDDLIFPYAHRVEILQKFANLHLQKVLPEFRGEAQYAYLGVVSIVALAWLLMRGCGGFVVGDQGRGSIWFPLAVLVILLGLVGGINFLLGNFGLVFFRATNRFSIILMAIALLFLCERVSLRAMTSRLSMAAAFAVLVLGLLDQVPLDKRNQAWVEDTRRQFVTDQRFATDLERNLTDGAMVFQLPVVEYPEAGERVRMSDYEHFRPYLFSERLRYSYGTIKGRGDADWQKEIAGLTPAEMLDALKRFGFEAVMVNRKGFEDSGSALIAALRTAGLETIADSPDLIAFRIDKSESARYLPPRSLNVVMGKGFYASESDGTRKWNWAVDSAEMVFARSFRVGADVASEGGRVAGFKVQGIAPGALSMSVNGAQFVQILAPGQSEAYAEVRIPGGAKKVAVAFKSDVKPRSPGKEDSRRLSFRVIDMEIRSAQESSTSN